MLFKDRPISGVVKAQYIQLISPYVVNNGAAVCPWFFMIWGLRNTQEKQMMELNHINGICYKHQSLEL